MRTAYEEAQHSRHPLKDVEAAWNVWVDVLVNRPFRRRGSPHENVAQEHNRISTGSSYGRVRRPTWDEPADDAPTTTSTRTSTRTSTGTRRPTWDEPAGEPPTSSTTGTRTAEQRRAKVVFDLHPNGRFRVQEDGMSTDGVTTADAGPAPAVDQPAAPAAEEETPNLWLLQEQVALAAATPTRLWRLQEQIALGSLRILLSRPGMLNVSDSSVGPWLPTLVT